MAAHERVQRARGLATAYTCNCGRQASHWAYQHDDPDELVTADGLPYSGSPVHYQPMCVSCHKITDLARRRAEPS